MGKSIRANRLLGSRTGRVTRRSVAGFRFPGTSCGSSSCRRRAGINPGKYRGIVPMRARWTSPWRRFEVMAGQARAGAASCRRYIRIFVRDEEVIYSAARTAIFRAATARTDLIGLRDRTMMERMTDMTGRMSAQLGAGGAGSATPRGVTQGANPAAGTHHPAGGGCSGRTCGPRAPRAVRRVTVN